MTEPVVDDHPFDFGLLSDDTFDSRDDYGPPQPGCHMGWCPVCIPFDPRTPSDQPCTCGARPFGEPAPAVSGPRWMFSVLRPKRPGT